jgi:hypothetical protein
LINLPLGLTRRAIEGANRSGAAAGKGIYFFLHLMTVTSSAIHPPSDERCSTRVGRFGATRDGSWRQEDAHHQRHGGTGRSVEQFSGQSQEIKGSRQDGKTAASRKAGRLRLLDIHGRGMLIFAETLKQLIPVARTSQSGATETKLAQMERVS